MLGILNGKGNHAAIHLFLRVDHDFVLIFKLSRGLNDFFWINFISQENCKYYKEDNGKVLQKFAILIASIINVV